MRIGGVSENNSLAIENGLVAGTRNIKMKLTKLVYLMNLLLKQVENGLFEIHEVWILTLVQAHLFNLHSQLVALPNVPLASLHYILDSLCLEVQVYCPEERLVKFLDFVKID